MEEDKWRNSSLLSCDGSDDLFSSDDDKSLPFQTPAVGPSDEITKARSTQMRSSCGNIVDDLRMKLDEVKIDQQLATTTNTSSSEDGNFEIFVTSVKESIKKPQQSERYNNPQSGSSSDSFIDDSDVAFVDRRMGVLSQPHPEREHYDSDSSDFEDPCDGPVDENPTHSPCSPGHISDTEEEVSSSGGEVSESNDSVPGSPFPPPIGPTSVPKRGAVLSTSTSFDDDCDAISERVDGRDIRDIQGVKKNLQDDLRWLEGPSGSEERQKELKRRIREGDNSCRVMRLSPGKGSGTAVVTLRTMKTQCDIDSGDDVYVDGPDARQTGDRRTENEIWERRISEDLNGSVVGMLNPKPCNVFTKGTENSLYFHPKPPQVSCFPRPIHTQSPVHSPTPVKSRAVVSKLSLSARKLCMPHKPAGTPVCAHYKPVGTPVFSPHKPAGAPVCTPQRTTFCENLQNFASHSKFSAPTGKGKNFKYSAKTQNSNSDDDLEFHTPPSGNKGHNRNPQMSFPARPAVEIETENHPMKSEHDTSSSSVMTLPAHVQSALATSSLSDYSLLTPLAQRISNNPILTSVTSMKPQSALLFHSARVEFDSKTASDWRNSDDACSDAIDVSSDDNDDDVSDDVFSPITTPKPFEMPALPSSKRKGRMPKDPTTIPSTSTDEDSEFLSSLSIPLTHQKASKYVKNFKRNKVKLTKKLFEIFNRTVFENKLPADMKLVWNAKLRKTAGQCRYEKRRDMTTGSVSHLTQIELSNKVLDSADRLRNTLIHELCHAAVWIVNGIRDGHGPYWKYWTRKAMTMHPNIPPIGRCHSYDIKTKFNYTCLTCNASFGRHSKSINTDTHCCPHCRGPLKLQTPRRIDGTPMAPKTPNRFAIFVKENYSVVKKDQSQHSHQEIMKKLSSLYSGMKLSNGIP